MTAEQARINAVAASLSSWAAESSLVGPIPWVRLQRAAEALLTEPPRSDILKASKALQGKGMI